MKLKLNGTLSEYSEGMTVAELLENLKVQSEGVAVEVNLEIIKKQAYPDRILEEGDSVEIVNFVGGG